MVEEGPGPLGNRVDADVIEAEMIKYENMVGRKGCLDPLQFWAKHETDFPYLAGAAPYFLAVTATAIRIEQVWSQAGRIHTKNRVRMSFRLL